MVDITAVSFGFGKTEARRCRVKVTSQNNSQISPTSVSRDVKLRLKYYGEAQGSTLEWSRCYIILLLDRSQHDYGMCMIAAVYPSRSIESHENLRRNNAYAICGTVSSPAPNCCHRLTVSPA
jgi:hypothetical protein